MNKNKGIYMKKFYLKNRKIFMAIAACVFCFLLIMPFATTKRVKIDAEYVDKYDVALYIKTYNELPKNYITKGGIEYAERHGISVSDKIVGGDNFFDEGKLSGYKLKGDVKLKECDIKGDSYSVENREQKRFLYTANAKKTRVFYTEDHYKTFTEIKTSQIQKTRNVWWAIFGVYVFAVTCFYVMTESFLKKEIRALRDGRF